MDKKATFVLTGDQDTQPTDSCKVGMGCVREEDQSDNSIMCSEKNKRAIPQSR